MLENNRQNVSQANAVGERQWLQVKSYLQDTGKGELNPVGIKRDIELLLNDLRAGALGVVG